jgi:hypothetical protein
VRRLRGSHPVGTLFTLKDARAPEGAFDTLQYMGVKRRPGGGTDGGFDPHV